jgi:site-specific DNA-methyltransferase (adenine-specific)
MKPYYEDNNVTIYHADARDIIELVSCDLVLTDPPYGIQKSSGTINKARAKGEYSDAFDDTPEYINSVVMEVIRSCISRFPTVVTPGNRNLMAYPQPQSFGCFYQPASVGMQVWGNADAQPILYYGLNPTKRNMGKKCSYTLTESPEKNGHPCPKPIKAWTSIMLNSSSEGMIILDPFMGSGTTLRAAKDTGRRAIGIEIEEKYCEIAANRMAQECFSF